MTPDSIDKTKEIIGNEIDDIVASAIISPKNPKKDLTQYRLTLFKYFKAFHLQGKISPAQIAKAWKDAEYALSPYKFAKLQELVNNDIEKIVSGQTTIH